MASFVTGEILHIDGTRYQRLACYEGTPQNMFNYLRQEVDGAVDDQTLRSFCDGSVRRLSWLERHGARFAGLLCDYKTPYPTDPHYLHFSGNERAYPYRLNATPAPRGHRQVAKDQTSPLQRLQMSFLITAGHRKAETLPEPAAELGISPSGLASTVAAYNDAAEAGRQDPAHKAPTLCRPLRCGPYYGIDISVRPSLAHFVPGTTLGGLRVEGASGQVLDGARSPIRGLYAAGRTAVGICSNSYVSGLSLADCVFSGIRAGEHAAVSSRISIRELCREQRVSTDSSLPEATPRRRFPGRRGPIPPSC